MRAAEPDLHSEKVLLASMKSAMKANYWSCFSQEFETSSRNVFLGEQSRMSETLCITADAVTFILKSQASVRASWQG